MVGNSLHLRWHWQDWLARPFWIPEGPLAHLTANTGCNLMYRYGSTKVRVLNTY